MGKIELISGADSISINSPQYGYDVDLHLALNIGRYSQDVQTVDYGTAYDYRVLKNLDMSLPESDMIDLVEFLRHSEARTEPFILRVPDSGYNFFPAGPDYGNVGDFTFQLYNQNQGPQKLEPYKYFDNKLEFLIKEFPDYTPEMSTVEGGFSIGTVNGLRYPELNPSPMHSTRNSISGGGNMGIVNLGSRADEYEVKINQPCGTLKAAELIKFLQSNNGRGNGIFLEMPVNYYIFGPECINRENHIVKMIDKVININHYTYEQFKISLKFWGRND